MTAKQTSLFESSIEVCKLCKRLSKVENRFYCSYFQSFLESETLTIPCDFFNCKGGKDD